VSALRTSAATPFGYAGQPYDAGPQTYDMRAREYDPRTGRFLSQDPAAPDLNLPITLNPYEYAAEQPTLLSDPSGRSFEYGTSSSPDYLDQSLIAGPRADASNSLYWTRTHDH